jgi:hypothetical protein
MRLSRRIDASSYAVKAQILREKVSHVPIVPVLVVVMVLVYFARREAKT